MKATLLQSQINFDFINAFTGSESFIALAQEIALREDKRPTQEDKKSVEAILKSIGVIANEEENLLVLIRLQLLARSIAKSF